MGRDLPAYAAERSPDAVSTLAISLPAEALADRGVEAVAGFASALASRLPVEHGYASLALWTDGSISAFAEIRGLCFNFPGLDLPDVRSGGLAIGSRIRGA